MFHMAGDCTDLTRRVKKRKKQPKVDGAGGKAYSCGDETSRLRSPSRSRSVSPSRSSSSRLSVHRPNPRATVNLEKKEKELEKE